LSVRGGSTCLIPLGRKEKKRYMQKNKEGIGKTGEKGETTSVRLVRKRECRYKQSEGGNMRRGGNLCSGTGLTRVTSNLIGCENIGKDQEKGEKTE